MIMAEHSDTHKLIIIGSGPAGLTAGVYAARANLNPLIIEGKKPGGQLMGTTYVENWPGEKSILGPQLMQNMIEHARHFGCEFLSGEITKVDFSGRPFKLWTNKNHELQAHAIIIATGAVPNKLGCPGEAEYWGKGVSTCAVCDGVFYRDKKVVIIGGGDTAMEEASFMTKFTDDVTIIHLLDTLTASFAMQERVVNDKRIKIIYNSTVTNFHGDGKNLTEITVIDQKTKKTTQMAVGAVFIAIGLKPSTDLFKGQLELEKSGYMVVTDHTKTSVEGIFSAGDVGDYRYRQAITSAGSGCMAALDAEKYLAKVHKL
jgi:thioredoxin reductase (NADPH)